MIHSVIKINSSSENPKIELPHMFRNKNGSIVLFNLENSGMRIDTKDSNLGRYYNSCLISCYNEKEWTPLKAGESITLIAQ